MILVIAAVSKYQNRSNYLNGGTRNVFTELIISK